MTCQWGEWRKHVLWKDYLRKEQAHLAREKLGDQAQDEEAMHQTLMSMFSGPKGSTPAHSSTQVSGGSGNTQRNGYRMPKAGEPVKVDGMRSRPHLNGVQGEVVSSGADDDGFVTVRLFTEGGGAASGAGDSQRKNFMKVRPHRLQPLGKSASAPGIERLLQGVNDWESARSLSTEGLGSVASRSTFSGVGSRRSGASQTASAASRSSNAASRASLGSSATPMPASWYKQSVGRDQSAYPTYIPGRMIPQEKWDKYAMR